MHQRIQILILRHGSKRGIIFLEIRFMMDVELGSRAFIRQYY